ncbi:MULTISPECIES: peptidase domain-containing ABC transporter [Pseudomonas]|uniref:ATP-binding cassette domain-containing protein n=1 Tax=Pseudomonas quercus TaxID=2722792 RepID=A0ABX0YJA0_9PSED|nr:MULTISPECIES: ABC transporter transmembrane domain-containing protein [Pseudomonas]MBF7144486.1 ATP-binding cassette domain-containing protein [Pseudomonas sp. LY10J]NJP03025.1 ATP-binding cassette domain-containing protein [Pseudomonas quercus]
MNSHPAIEHGADTALWALVQLARHYRIPACATQLAHEQGEHGHALNDDQLQLAARSLGFDTRILHSTRPVRRLPLPAIGRDRRNHAYILWRQVGDNVWIQGANDPEPFAVSHTGWRSRSNGRVLLARPVATQTVAPSQNGFQWCWPVLRKYRHHVLSVLVAGVGLLAFSMVTPLFFQVVMDNVLVHNNLSTLQVVMLGLVATLLFETAFSAARYGVFAYPLARLDAELKAALFNHVVALAPGFFSVRPIGDIASRLRELDTVRDFLTHHCLAVVLDGVFSFAFLAIMFAYSPALTAVVAASLVAYGAIALLWGPALHRQAMAAQALSADNQAFLVESVNAVRTLKGLAAERWSAAQWDDRLTQATLAQRRLGLSAASAQETIGLVGKLVTAATLWWGAQAVMSGALTVGSFIAFNLYAARVAQPALRMGQVWGQYQQTRVALQRLSVILQAPVQVAPGAVPVPALSGRIDVDSVCFRYEAEGPYVLNHLSFSVPAGQCIGITGPSGSGKSTVLKLLLGFAPIAKGHIRMDGYDIALADIASVRRQVGVVMQHPFLFQGTVHENIALSLPGASRARVIQAAQLAGAHGFIQRLPQGYDTRLAEAGSNLSGGQRQRLAIARALLPEPPILIFDEATSALDSEAQAHLQSALPAICQGRTVIMIAHRLETLQGCDQLLVLDKGQVVEQGRPSDLALLPQGHYARLLRLQQEAGA